MDRLVLEQFMICMPLECQVLVKESGVESCQELEDMLINQQKPKKWDKKGFLPATIPDPRVREGRTPKENMEQDLVEDKEDTRTPTQSQEPELRKGPETEEPTAGGNRGESVRRLTRSKRRRASSLTSQEGLQEGAPSLDTGRCSGQPQTSSACSAGRVKTTSHAKGKEAPGGTDYQCRECNKRFHYRSQFTLHKRTHTGERPFQCSLCAKAFMQPSDLRVHQRIHTGEKPYRCDTCSRDFTHDSTLRAHKRTHTKERPFPCEQCDMAFSHRGNLNVHRRTHSGLKPYVCPECHGAFRQLGTFKRHQKTHLKRPLGVPIAAQ
ncbi:zinc finger and SCAN domain-containing protein 5B-like [Sus scrofa]|uniref:zinc finger and SCAN domain-containing protein 5B-like n=1 Tax=Sus scrofa TaxID=9823 RepID=UPI000A2B7884|nr:zinc finger and SCAN domain-containing protein 5B-like [Sus scrofa]